MSEEAAARGGPARSGRSGRRPRANYAVLGISKIAVLQSGICDLSWWMSAPDSPRVPCLARKTRRDGWTADRQIAFLAALASTRSVATAAASAGISRESAYRLRRRPEGALFAALWDKAMCPASRAGGQVHIAVLADGRLARLLGPHFRRKTANFFAVPKVPLDAGEARRTGTL